MQLVHDYGGRNLWHKTHTWAGLRFDHARWQVSEDEGITRSREHLIFVTLAGSIRRTSARIEDGPRYDGADFPGAVSFVPSMRQRRASYADGVIEYAAIRLDPGGLRALDGIEPDRLEFTGFTNRPDPFVHQLSLALGGELSLGALYAESAATVLLAHLIRNYSNVSRLSGPSRCPELSGRALREVLDFVYDNLGEDLRLARLAEIAGLDRYRFSHAFKAATGVPPHRYVTERRLERAARLLRSREALSIADIAYAVGMSSQSHLTTAFRRRYGVTPHAYRVSVTA